ncbi:MAG TPA: DUF4905 domain-containing protein [Fulvivirga sp.]|nr:DUF4905 domain-containing protein [Fulvivirga sp.]
MVRNLDLIFSHAFKGKVWSINTDNEGKKLLLEIRDDKIMEASFYIFDLENSVLGNKILLDEQWLISPFYVSNSILIFQTYLSEANPDVANYIGWSLKENKEIWWHDQWKNVSIVNDQLLVKDENNQEPTVFDVSNGQKTTLNRNEIGENILNILSPEFYPQKNQYFPTIERFVEQMISENIKVGAEYIEYNEIAFISYYTGQQKMANNLLVVDQNKEILLHEALGNDLEGIGKDTFFIQHNKLIFVKNKTELLIHQLP